MNETVINVQKLCKTYMVGSEKLVILDAIDWSLAEGEVVSVIGESGSGKSTLLNMIGGLDQADSGNIIVAGKDLCSLSEQELAGYRNSRIGFIFQFHYLLKDFTAVENIMIPALMAGDTKSEARSKALALLESVELGNRADSWPVQLSGGERQRIAAARALINDPALILADEPTGNLDRRNAAIMEDLLLGLCKSRGKTMILVTHDSDFAAKTDKVFKIREGSLWLQ
jgi:lipoprotein-releasing system ATP-binding protein